MTIESVESESAAAGLLSVHGRNTFDLLRESIYGDPQIVFRELVSNALDAIAKRTQDDPDAPAGRVEVVLDQAAATLQVRDNGIGMSDADVRRYINQIALSGTAERVQAWQEAPESSTIGQFGIGFYSAFMLADTVELQTLASSGVDPVHWTCNSDMAWQMEAGQRVEPGTTVILHLPDDSPYLAKPARAREALAKYFPFPRVEIALQLPDEPFEPVGDIDPVWRRESFDSAQMCTFYRDYFGESHDPLHWLQVESKDLGLRGVVFVRDTRGGAEAIDGRVDVLSRGVYVDSNVPALVPKFVNLQNAIIECDQLPLVVSRAQVRQTGSPSDIAALVSECLSQEMAIAFHQLFSEQRSRYEQLWPEIGPFVKYGSLTDRIFSSVMMRKMLFENLTGGHQTIAEYLEAAPQEHLNTIFYASDLIGQASYVAAFADSGIAALILDHVIDQALMQRLEPMMKGARFVRLDADVARVLAEELTAEDRVLGDQVSVLFQDCVERYLPGTSVSPVSLRVPELSVVLSSDEDSRRMSDLAQASGLTTGRFAEPLPAPPQELLVNVRNPLVKGLVAASPQRAALATDQLVALALLGKDELAPDQIVGFLARSQQILADYLNSEKE
jgi:molecular chaperone HtpG